MAKRVSGETIRNFILRTLHIHQTSIIKATAKRFGVPKPLIIKHVDQLLKEGKLRRMKNSLSLVGKEISFTNPINVRDREDEVYRDKIEPHIATLSDGVQRICYYGFTEMYNNVIDHSEGTTVKVYLSIYDYSIEILIRDNGVGIFEKIKKAFGLEDHRQVLIELAKGGLTTDPERHSGQGIFFTSRAFDNFWIISKGASFNHNQESPGDWLLEDDKQYNGTLVNMSIARHSDRVLSKIFDQFTVDKEELTVFKTHAPLRLASLASGDFVSRSQAKRILAKFNKYEEVFLDFKGIDFIGQGFADEIFRVFQSMNRDTKLIYINENEDVRSMIEFARKTVPSGPLDVPLIG